MRPLTLLVLVSLLGCSSNNDDNNAAVDMATSPDVGGEDTAEENNTEAWLVAHYRTPCSGEGSFLCLQYEEGGQMRRLFGGVDGFDWQWGRDYEIEVLVTEVEDPPADGSSLEYSLVELVSETPVDPATQFTWVVNPPPPGNPGYFSVDAAGNTGTLLDGRAFRCDPASVCDDMTTLQGGTEAYEIEFRYDDPIDEALIATSAAVQPPP